MIVVTGATGQLGRAIALSLVKRVPAAQIGVSAREPDNAEELAQLGVRVRHGDFEDKASLAKAFEGATQVLVVSSNARASGGDTLAQHRNAIEAAKGAGVKRIVYTSQISSSPTSAFAPALDHAATEVMLRDSGLAWTALRNGFYATSAIHMTSDAWTSGVLEGPPDGKVSWTAHADLADAAAAILASEGRFDGPTPPLTGAEALDFEDLARIGSEILGRSVRRWVTDDEAQRAKLVARGVPAVVAEIALGYYRASRAGEFAAVDPTLEGLIGRKPIPMRDVMAEKLAAKTA